MKLIKKLKFPFYVSTNVYFPFKKAKNKIACAMFNEHTVLGYLTEIVRFLHLRLVLGNFPAP